eukprot:TRINITY_DN89589_c0_g1_i1.p1 TRINITY_DN89589_c0_g1~~TRINITY_DN89589_c0_g1_i1.p1  ORF type:complete len:1078 (-),score=96.37 TRINITY_DN89589_c0_g1_i1:93-3326(-)
MVAFASFAARLFVFVSPTDATVSEAEFASTVVAAKQADDSHIKYMPTTCNGHGVVVLQSGTIYHSRVGHSFPKRCKRLHGNGSAVLVNTSQGSLSFLSAHIVLSGSLRFVGAQQRCMVTRGDVQISGDANVLFEKCNGGGMHAGGQVAISGRARVLFLECHSNSSGGGFFAQSSNVYGKATVVFDRCTTQADGGGFAVQRGSFVSGKARVHFNGCECYSRGGGFFAELRSVTFGFAEVSFQSCKSKMGWGGGVFVGKVSLVPGGGIAWIAGNASVSFKNCTSRLHGGGIATRQSVVVTGRSSVTFFGCRSFNASGGGFATLHSIAWGNSSISFAHCHSGQGGGGFVANTSLISRWSSLEFERCKSEGSGGGIQVRNSIISGHATLRFINCSAKWRGGSFYTFGSQAVNESAVLEIVNSSSGELGGGLFVGNCSFSNTVTLMFEGCRSSEGHGIYSRNRIIIGDSVNCSFPKQTKLFVAEQNIRIGILPEVHKFDNLLAKSNRGVVEFQLDESSIFLKSPRRCPPGTSPKATINLDNEVVWGLDYQKVCIECPPGTISLHSIVVPRNGTFPGCRPCARLGDKAGHAVITCENNVAVAPSGVMLRLSNSSTPEVFRCANINTCVGARSLGTYLDGSSVIQDPPMCESGYIPRSKGCTSCAMPRYGRSATDPFVCNRCSAKEFAWTGPVVFLLKPMALLVYGMTTSHSSRKQGEARLAGTLLKMTLSYSTITLLVVDAVSSSPKFHEQSAYWAETGAAIMKSYDIVSTASKAPMYVSSLDCLAGHTLTTTENLVFVLSVPGIGLIVIVLWCLAEMMFASDDSFLDKFLRYFVVWQNQFYPGIVAAFAAFLPCVSLQDDLWLEAFMLERECQNGFPSLPSLLCSAVGVASCFLTGPVLWYWLLASKDFSYRDRWVFLTDSYDDDYAYWESLVLARKMALAFLAAKIPVSYAPERFLAWTLAVVVIALYFQIKVHPYREERFPVLFFQYDINRLERDLIFSGTMCLIIGGGILSRWWNEPLLYFYLGLLLLMCALVPACLVLSKKLIESYSSIFHQKIQSFYEPQDSAEQTPLSGSIELGVG